MRLYLLQVQAYYGFQPLTAYLSVNYLDRFLCSRRLPVRFFREKIIICVNYFEDSRCSWRDASDRHFFLVTFNGSNYI